MFTWGKLIEFLSYFFAPMCHSCKLRLVEKNFPASRAANTINQLLRSHLLIQISNCASIHHLRKVSVTVMSSQDEGNCFWIVFPRPFFKC